MIANMAKPMRCADPVNEESCVTREIVQICLGMSIGQDVEMYMRTFPTRTHDLTRRRADVLNPTSDSAETAGGRKLAELDSKVGVGDKRFLASTESSRSKDNFFI